MTLTIDNSISRVEGMTPGQFADLRELLSYLPAGNQSYFAGKAYGVRRYLIDKKGYFGTGLVYLVERYAKDKGVRLLTTDLRRAPKRVICPFVMNIEHSPYPEQLEAAKALYKANRGVIAAVTGVGKSLIAALIINEVQVRTLVVVPSLELKRQLTATLTSAFGEDRVGGFGADIAVENVDALDSNVKADSYGCVIIDEFHHAGANTYLKLNKKSWNGIYYRCGLTATPFRSRDEERLLLESVLSQVVYRISYKRAVENKRIVPIEVYYLDLPKQEMKGAENNWQAVYSELVVNNDIRNRVIEYLLESLQGYSTLCLVKEIAHGELLSRNTGVAFANGQADNTRQLILEFRLGERGQLIGTTGVIGEGVDCKPAEWVILATGGKSKNALFQQIGRVVRAYPGKESGKVIMFRDVSSKYLLRHFNQCVKFIRDEYGVEPVKLSMPTSNLVEGEKIV